MHENTHKHTPSTCHTTHTQADWEDSHSLYCCSWANSAGLRHTQLVSPMLPGARDWGPGAGGRGPGPVNECGLKGVDGYPWVKLCKKTEEKKRPDVISASLQQAPCEHAGGVRNRGHMSRGGPSERSLVSRPEYLILAFNGRIWK